MYLFADIVEGNLKCIMRLVLALAAHFKPNSVKHQSVAGVISPNRGRSLASIAQVRFCYKSNFNFVNFNQIVFEEKYCLYFLLYETLLRGIFLPSVFTLVLFQILRPMWSLVIFKYQGWHLSWNFRFFF